MAEVSNAVYVDNKTENEENRFDLFSVLVFLRRFWILIVLFTILGVVVGVGLGYWRNQTYYTQTKSVICIAKINDKNMLTNISLTNRLIPTIQDQVTTQLFIDEANRLYETTGREGTISANSIKFSVGKTLIFQVSYTDTDKETATIKLDTYLEALKEVYKNYGTQLTTGDEVNFKIIDNVPQTATRNRFITYVLIGVAGGVLLGIGIAFLIFIFDNRIRSKDELERITGASVVAFIDRVKSESEKK